MTEQKKLEYPLVPSQYLDDDRWGLVDQRNAIVVGVSANMTRDRAGWIAAELNAAHAVKNAVAAPTERRFTLEEMEKVIIATWQGWNRKIQSIETFCKIVRSRLLAPKPEESVTVEEVHTTPINYSSNCALTVTLDGKPIGPLFSQQVDAERYAAGLRAELAKQEGA